ncbi:hypothetical protein R2601_03848 [Salipiger bermudensis HTCC2601]|uniref:Uncharacterized protein n=1 Tax=Salipiger bermudensis (strain DSM 26914 / JCM 13377 / KCTC 12554 / HTCC2601) TaxID=314265 RepID=Q0FW76_SALBH|nr:hypothetical protein R2601_03848 [Salipiger bermudensis HTCC2601]
MPQRVDLRQTSGEQQFHAVAGGRRAGARHDPRHHAGQHGLFRREIPQPGLHR